MVALFSDADIAAAQRVLAAAQRDPAVLHDARLGFLADFITHFHGTVPSAPAPPKASAAPQEETEEDNCAADDPECWAADSLDSYVGPTGADDETDEGIEMAQQLKAEGQEKMSEGDFDGAIAKYTEALKRKPSSAMWWALRADAFLHAKKPNAAIRDATAALERNPDSARALRVRGTANRHLCRWEQANEDLNASQQIDFNEAVAELLKVVEPKAKHIREQRHLKEKQQFEQRQAELRAQRARELAAEQEEEAKAAPPRHAHGAGAGPGFAGGFPGMPSGMGLPPGMEELFSDPEIAELLQQPGVMEKMGTMLSNPAAAMQDPQLQPIVMRMMQKMNMGGAMPKQPPQPKAAPSAKPAQNKRFEDLD